MIKQMAGKHKTISAVVAFAAEDKVLTYRVRYDWK